MRVIAIEEHFVLPAIIAAGGTTSGPTPPGIEAKLFDLGEQRIEAMDAAGISFTVLSHNTPATQVLTPEQAIPLAREANDVLARAVSAHPDRFAGFATVPTPDPRAAARELERAVRELGMRGAAINGHTRGRFLDDQSFWPIFEVAEGLDVPIYLHPTEPPRAVHEAYYAGFAPRVEWTLARTAWGWHVETGLHVLRMILGGVFDRFPRLQVVVGHLGEALPFMLARANGLLPPTATGLRRSIEEYMLTNVSVTTSALFTLPPFLCALLTLGAERILFAVDYPYSANEQARAFLDGLPVSPEDRERIAHVNAERLLHL